MIKIYTDGSFINGKCGFGAVISNNGTIMEEISGAVTDPQSLRHRQVAGEVEAVLQALKWCSNNGVNECEIYFDYQGVQSWATGGWKRKTALTQTYHDLLVKSEIKIKWVKVKAHSGDPMNDKADRLAKAGCGLANNEVMIKKDPLEITTNVLLDQAEKIGIDFTEYLNSEDIDAYYSGTYNDMYSRVEIGSGKDRIGIVDIYNTKKKSLKPDFRGFKNDFDKKIINDFWDRFLKASLN